QCAADGRGTAHVFGVGRRRCGGRSDRRRLRASLPDSSPARRGVPRFRSRVERPARGGGGGSVGLRILFSGMVCGDPWQAGASWAVAQYMLGLRRLGHDVWLVEPVDGELDTVYADEVMRAFDLDGRVAFLRRETGDVVYGAGWEAIAVRPFDLLV